MIAIRNSQHLRRVLRHLREQAGITQRDLANRLFVSQHTITNRESGIRRWDTDATVDTANIVGYDLVLVRQRRRGVRPTGTGWPA